MSANARLHDLLPWFVSGKLVPAEAEAFRGHLESCAACRDDLAVVRRLKAELDEHGAALLEDHPTPDALVGTVLSEIDGDEAAQVQRHLALCATCELEGQWVTGEATVEAAERAPALAPAPSFWVRHAAWGWTLSAAAALALVVVPLIAKLRGSVNASPGGMLKPAIVAPTVLGEGSSNVFKLGAGDAGVVLVLEVDLLPAAFPITVEVTDSTGKAVYHRAGISREYLVRELHLLVPCERDACGPGSYVARIRGSNGGDELSFPFEIQGQAE
jgi:hypothetical protein